MRASNRWSKSPASREPNSPLPQWPPAPRYRWARSRRSARRWQIVCRSCRRAGDGEWPDATVAARFRFRHSLYREVIYGRVTASRRAQSHRRIGERLQAACGESASDMAAELAWHFEQGRDNDRALHYREVAAQRAWQRAALQEAYEHLTAALRIAGRLPQGPLRTQHELQLNVALAAALQNSQGWGVPEVERTYAVVEKLCEGLD